MAAAPGEQPAMQIPTPEEITQAQEAADANPGNRELKVRALGMQALYDLHNPEAEEPKPTDTTQLPMRNPKASR